MDAACKNVPPVAAACRFDPGSGFGPLFRGTVEGLVVHRRRKWLDGGSFPLLRRVYNRWKLAALYNYFLLLSEDVDLGCWVFALCWVAKCAPILKAVDDVVSLMCRSDRWEA